FRSNPIEPQFAEVEPVNEGVNGTSRIVLIDPVLQAFRKQSRLLAIAPLNEAPHPIPPQIPAESYSANQTTECVFTQARPKGNMARSLPASRDLIASRPAGRGSTTRQI